MPTKNRASSANDKEGVPFGRASRVSWPLVGAGLGLVALAALMYVAVALYRPAQAATPEEHIEDAKPQPTPEPTPTPAPPAEPRRLTAPPTRVRRSPAPPPRRPKPAEVVEPTTNESATGRIEVSTQPGGYPITIDGQTAGETADCVRAIELDPGPHTVEILFPLGTRWSQVFNIVAGRKNCIAFNYRPRTIKIPHGDTPPDAQTGGKAETVDLGDVTGTVCGCGEIALTSSEGPVHPRRSARAAGGASTLRFPRVGATGPAAAPTPTPGAPVAAPPHAEVKERDKIVARYPERLLKDKDSTLRVELSRVLGEVVADTTTADGKVETVDTHGAIAGAANPEATMAEAFGSGYKAFATVKLISDDLVTTASPQPEQLLDPASLEWEWHVRPKEGVGERVHFAFQIDVVWRGEGLPDIQRSAVWRKEINVPVGLPGEMLLLKYGSGPSGAGGGGAMLAGVFKKRKKRREGEEDDDVGGDESVAVTPPGAAVATAAAAAAAAPPAPAADEVHCTVYAPPEARPGDMLKVQVFAHLAEQAALLAALAAERDDEAREGGSEALKRKIERGKELTFTLDMPGLKVKETERCLVWNGEPDSVRFTVTVPDECKPKVVWGTVEILYESVPVGEVEFKFKVVTESAQVAPAVAAPVVAQPPPAEQREVMFTKAFISYSRKDSEMVLEKVQMLEAQGIECYLDIMTFKPGEEWGKMINHYIDVCDVFFLFWSNASKSSPEVDKEIRYALQRREQAAPRPVIKPIPIEGPPVVTPPPYLSNLHFDDRYRYFIKAKQAERLETQPPPPAAPGAA